MKFRWICRLGAGAFGEVWRAIWPGDNKEYAVKLLKEPYASNVLRRFEREGIALRSLRHPNIVTCSGFIALDRGPGLVMEYLPGGSLRAKIGRLKPPMSRIIQIIYGVLDGLQHAHASNMIHRDIKPDNIVFTSEGVPKIGDFGLVKMLFDGGDGTVGIVGTAGYIAPELIDNPKAVTPKVDIFSTGVTLYEMLTGLKLQFDGPRLLPPSIFNSAVNEDLDAVVLKMVEPNPEKRCSTAQEAANALAPLWKTYADWEAEKAREQKEAVLTFLKVAACVLLAVGLVGIAAKATK